MIFFFYFHILVTFFFFLFQFGRRKASNETNFGRFGKRLFNFTTRILFEKAIKTKGCFFSLFKFKAFISSQQKPILLSAKVTKKKKKWIEKKRQLQFQILKSILMLCYFTHFICFFCLFLLFPCGRIFLLPKKANCNESKSK